MSEPVVPTAGSPQSTVDPNSAAAPPDGTTVVDIAGRATQAVTGVYAMGTNARRAVPGIIRHAPGRLVQDATGGVEVDRQHEQLSLTVAVVLTYGFAAAAVGQQVREAVITAVEGGTGLDVTAVDVEICDVHRPGELSDADAAGSDIVILDSTQT